MPTSFRGHYLLYWDHHQVLLHPRMNIGIDSSRWPFPPSQLTPMFSVKVPLQNRICCVWSSVPRGCQEQRACHSESPQTDDISIQLPESKRPKDSFLLCSLIIFLDRSLWVQLSHIFLCIITSCQVSKHWQSHHTSQFTQNIFECHIPTFPNTPSHCTLSTC